MENLLRILHISDLHERMPLEWMDEKRKRTVEMHAAGRYRVLESNFLEVLDTVRSQRRIDIICFTGDIADWGLKEEYEKATLLFTNIIHASGVPWEHLFLVPGNHDVCRKQAENEWREMRNLALEFRLQDSLSDWMAGGECPYGAQSNWCNDILERTAPFWEWVTGGLGRAVLNPKRSRHGRLGYDVPVENLSLPFPVHIIGLDSAWLAGEKNDARNLLLTHGQVDLLTTDSDGKPLPGFRLALIHHPLFYLSDDQRCYNLLHGTVDLLLHGHQHDPIVMEQKDPDRELHIAAAGCLYEGDEGDKWINSFHVLDVYFNDKGKPLRYEIEFYGWSSKGYWHRTGGVYKSASEGRLTWWTKLGERWRDEQALPRIAGTRPRADHAFFDMLFKDRIEACQDMGSLLSDRTKRLICIFGHGGMGKTALVGKVLWEIERCRCLNADRQIPVDGIVYLGKEEGITFENLVENCANVLSSKKKEQIEEIRRSNLPPEKKIKKLLKALSDGLYIILIDGLEDLLDDQGKFKIEHKDLEKLFELILETSSGSKLLLTSRVPLKIDDGRLTAFAQQNELNKGLPEDDAVAFLRQLDPDGTFGLKDAADTQLRKIVKVTHGIPRALELVVTIIAQSRNRRLTLEQVAKRFYQMESVVEELVEENYKGLDTDARGVMEALAVFDRPVREDAILFMLGKPPDDQGVYGIIDRLVDTHVVSWDRSAQVLSLHPIDRCYAYSCIPEEDGGYNLKALHRRAADYYATQRRPEDQWKGIKDIEPQLLEFNHRFLAEDYNGAAQLVDGIDYSWANHHKFQAYMLLWGYGRRSVSMRDQLRGKLDKRLEALNLGALGWVCKRIGQSDKALQYLNEGLVASEEAGDPEGQMLVRTELGFLYNDRFADHESSVSLFNEVLTEARKTNQRYWEGMAYLGLSYAEFDFGNDKEALDYANQSLYAFREVNNLLREIDSLVRLGMIYRKIKNYSAAVEVMEEGLKAARKAGLKQWEGELLSGMGFNYRGSGEYDRALDYHRQSLNHFAQEYATQREVAVQHSYLANLLIDLGEIQEAVAEYKKALEISIQIGIEHERSWFLGGLGIACGRLGSYDEGLVLESEAFAIVENSKNLRSQVIRLTDQAETALLARRYDEASEKLLLSLRVAAKIQLTEDIQSLPDAYLRAPYLADALPHEMQSPGDHQRRGIILTRIYLHTDRLLEAVKTIQVTRKDQHESASHRNFTALLHGLILHRLGQLDEATRLYHEALKNSKDSLRRAPRNYEAQYTQGLASAGLAVMTEGQTRDTIIRQAQEAYQKALEMCNAAGVVSDARFLLSELPADSKFAEQVLFEANISGELSQNP